MIISFKKALKMRDQISFKKYEQKVVLLVIYLFNYE